MGMPVISSSNTTRSQAITDIIQSVALEEAAMADATPEILLQTNKSVESMVGAVTRLEMILQSKLSAFEGCLCEGTVAP